MKIHKIYPNGFGSNTYAITNDGKTAVVIDPCSNRVESKLLSLGLEPKFVLLTHCHFDHVGGVSVLQQAGAKVLCLDKESVLVNTKADLADLFGAPIPPYTVNETLVDGQEIELCGLKIKVLATPGHTAGSTCYLFMDDGGRYLFSGDTLFENSIGRTDFPTGNIHLLPMAMQF